MMQRKRIIFSLPAIIIAVTIFILSSGPQPYFPRLGFQWEDKLIHLVVYFIFGLSISIFVLANVKDATTKKIAILTLIAGSLFAISDELHQYFVPGRYCEFFDWLADFFGILLSLLFINMLKKKIVN